MVLPKSRHYLLIALPFILTPSTALVFSSFSKRLGKEPGYLLGFISYWTVWCVIVPLAYMGRDGFRSLLSDITPLLSRPNWLAAVLFITITLVTLVMYGREFIQAPLTLILIALPIATINGICEEIAARTVTQIPTIAHTQ